MSTSLTVTTELRSQYEIVIHAQFLQALFARREQEASQQQNTPASPAAEPVVQPAPTQTYTGPQLVKDTPAAPAPAPAPAAPRIDRAEVETKFREYITRVGTAAARALLDKYAAPFLKDVAADKLEAFVAEISA